jgi:hypothetical protein
MVTIIRTAHERGMDVLDCLTNVAGASPGRAFAADTLRRDD